MDCYTKAIITVYIITIFFIINLEKLKERNRLEEDKRYYKELSEWWRQRWLDSENARRDLIEK